MKSAYFLAATLTYGALATPAVAASDFTTNPAAVKAGTYSLDPSHGKITWSLSHLGFSTYTGQFSDVTGTLVLDPKAIAKTTLNVSVDISSIGTLNPVLDTELKSDKFFNAAKFPTATFVSTKVIRTGKTTADVDGELTLLGVTKPQVLKVTFNLGGTNPIVKVYELGFEGHAVLKRSEFGLSAYVPYVGDTVSLDLEGEFHLNS
jgi:polyisoprenoid-binding protein YceI